MELALEGDTAVQVEGEIVIELPDYMKPLSPIELAEARASQIRSHLILAAGRHPNSDIHFITGDGRIMELTRHTQEVIYFPTHAQVVPIHHGHALHCIVTGSIQNDLHSDWALRVSKPLVGSI